MLSVLSMMEDHLEDEDDDIHHHHQHHHHHHHMEGDPPPHHTIPLTKAELRKSNKPIMEKRRRARINTCLNELKSLILDAMKKDPARHSKLEKADILEMTVKHLQAVQRQQLALAVAHDPGVLSKFRGGFAECAQEVTRYVSRIEGVEGGVRQRLLQHLGQCVSGLSAMTPLSFTAMAGLPLPLSHLQGSTVPQAPPPTMQQSPGDVNNNQARILHGLVAARLAAAGDTAGAALLLQGGLSLLARAGPHAQPNTQQPPSVPNQGIHSAPPHPPPPQTGIQPIQRIQPPISKINEGASSSGERPPRPSAFTAVRRTSSPSRVSVEAHNRSQESISTHLQQIIAPTARRIVTVPESKQETVISAQVAVKPVNLTSASESREGDIRSPLDFSFKKRQLERPTPTHPTITIPTPKHPTAPQALPAHTEQKEIILQHPTPTHPLPKAPLHCQMPPNSTLPHIPPKSHQSVTEPVANIMPYENPHNIHSYHTSLPSSISMPKPNIPISGPYNPVNTQNSGNSHLKRQLDDPESLSPPSKLPKMDLPHDTIPATSIASPDTLVSPPVALSSHPEALSSPTDASSLPSSELSPLQDSSLPGPSPKKTCTTPPSSLPPGTSSDESPEPKKEVTSEDNVSPEKHPASTPNDDKDMWRPW